MGTKKTFSELINSDTPTLVDFYADWCGPCKMMAPVIDQIASEMAGKVKVLKVDVDRNQKAAHDYKIQGVPTFILFKKGKIVWQQAGGVPSHTLKNIIQQHV